jgi:hypothetical protein
VLSHKGGKKLRFWCQTGRFYLLRRVRGSAYSFPPPGSIFLPHLIYTSTPAAAVSTDNRVCWRGPCLIYLLPSWKTSRRILSSILTWPSRPRLKIFGWQTNMKEVAAIGRKIQHRSSGGASTSQEPGKILVLKIVAVKLYAK